MAVNDELGEIEKGLEAAEQVLKTDGRLVVITFHSLEDRLVKRWLKERATFEVLTKKPITATREEILTNPRSRSAKLRVARRI
jgi:16S rRNA (cytosine1402-N4)-methyltransferase